MSYKEDAIRRPTIRLFFFLVPAIWLMLLAGCGGGGTSPNTSGGAAAATTYAATSGVAQKGPLIQGGTVTAQELTAALSPTGKQYSYQISSNLGTFSPSSAFTSQYLGLSATGYYYDEVANDISGGTITLNGYSDLSASPIVNINLLTTLAYQRIKSLVTVSNMPFAAAQAQAESEVLAAFNIKANNYGDFGTLDISRKSDGDHILAAISCIFTYGNSSGNLSALIAAVQSDIGANGAITNAATRSVLSASSKAVNPTSVASNLTQEYSSQGVAFSATDVSDWLDQDGDGLVGKVKFQVSGASQTSQFSIPTSVTDTITGSSVTVSSGTMAVNGTTATGAVQIKTGDVVAISPPSGVFPEGLLNVYLFAGSSKIARVSFISSLASITVSPNGPTIPIGLQLQFAASGTFSDGRISDLTSSATWKSTAPATASVNATNGLVKALALGQSVITAQVGAVSGTAPVTVSAAALQSLAVTPNPYTTGLGIPRQLIATGTYSDGSTGIITNIATWTSLSPGTATVTGGIVTGVAPGPTTIQASIGAVSGPTAVTVTSNAWSLTEAPLFGTLNSTATVLPSGNVIVAGGYYPPDIAIPRTQIYAPLTDTWIAGPNMIVGRYGHTATRLADGTILVTGGYTNRAPSPSIANSELYSPETNSWTTTGTMSAPRGGHTANLLNNGKILVAGGGTTINFSQPVSYATTELYDPNLGTWAPGPPMSNARSGHTATVLPNGHVLVTGGGSATAEIYDPGSNTWSSAGSMSTARTGHTAILLANGNVLVVGGGNTPAPYLSSTEIYNPTSNAWSLAASMPFGVSQQGSTALASGKILIIGGQTSTSNGAGDTSAELYDPTTDSWSSVASMSTGRYSPNVNLLPIGAVLVTAGSFGTLPQTAELYW